MIDPKATIKKLDEDGDEIETSEEEKDEAFKALRDAIKSGKVQLAPGAAESIKEAGLTLDEIMSMLLGEEKH